MEVGEPVPASSSNTDYSQELKNKSESDDWILQPDTDRKTGDTDLPVIQSITSLSNYVNDSPAGQNGSKQVGKFGDNEEKNPPTASDDEDSEGLIIDTSLSTVDSDTPTKTALSPRRKNGKNTIDNQGSNPTTDCIKNNTEERQQTAAASAAKVPNGIRRVSTEKEPISSSTSQEQTEVPSAEQDSLSPKINVTKDKGQISDKEIDSNETPGESQSENSKITPHDSNIRTPSNHSLNSDSSLAKPQAYGLEKDDNGESIIVIEPHMPNFEPVKWDQINFIPGAIKQEPKDTSSTTPPKTTAGSFSVSASLTTGTSLSSALQTQPCIIPTMQINSTPNLIGPRTILRSPGKPMPQFLFRHVGPGARPSYVRLGSQALQQIARLTSPTAVPATTNAQRMISVLMDRSQATAAGTGLATGFPHIVPGKQPGTFIAGGNPNNPLKVLIIPSQANVNVPGAKSAPSLSSTPSFANINMVTASSAMNIPTMSTDKPKTNKNAQPTSKAPKISGQKQGKKSNGSKVSKNNSASSNSVTSTEIGLNLTLTEERFKRRMLGKTNVRKPYHPNLSNNVSMQGFGLYLCSGCKDVFINRSSLELHKNRQSISLSFKCDVCNKKLQFFNKCQFRCHMLKHVPELKNLTRHLLESIEIQALTNSGLKPSTDSQQEGDLQMSTDSIEKILTEKESPSLENTAEIEPEGEKQNQSTIASEPEPTLGLTISSVSSISPDENIPVGDAPPTSVGENRHSVERSLANPKVVSVESTPISTQALPIYSVSSQPIMGLPYAVAEPLKTAVRVSRVPETKIEPKPTLITEVKPHTGPMLTNITQPYTTTQIPLTPTLAKIAPPPEDLSEGGNVYCTECSKTFQSYMALQKHFNDADKPHPLKPPCCLVKLSSECCVRAHMRMHKWSKPYVCPDCGIYFRGDLAIFKKHRENCKRIMQAAMIVYPCRKCPTWYQHIDELRHHIREKHSECYLKCNLCPMAFKSMPSFREHNSSKHLMKSSDRANYSSIYKCPLCDSVFHDQRLKFEHLEHHINNIYATQKVSFLCFICKKLSYSYTSMRTHLREKHRITALGNMCDYCGVDCGTISSFVSHQKKMHSAIPANMLVVPSSTTEMQAAVGERDKDSPPTESLHHPGSSVLTQTDDKPLQRPTIEILGKDEVSTPLDNASRDTHSPSNASRSSSMYSECASDDTPSVNGKKYKCHICLNVFPDRKALIRHKKMDHGLMKRRRRRGDQGGGGPEKKVKVEEDMRTPELQVKSDFMLRFQCDDCAYRTTSFVDLQEHRRESHGLKARFPCHLCGKTFESAVKVEEHQKATHEGSVREYPYMCWICDEKNIRKGYSKRANLVKHIINVHKIASRLIDTERLNKMDENARLALLEEETKKEDPLEASSSRRPTDAQDDVLKCIKCDFQCESREVFTDHIHKHRLASDSFLCHECGLCFTVLTALKNHLRLVHRIKKFDDYVDKYKIKLCSPPAVEKPKRLMKERRVSSRELRNSLECTVCYKIYPDEGALKNHMRSHGMAFIRSKRLSPMAFIVD